jgi:hypothetical protein
MEKAAQKKVPAKAKAKRSPGPDVNQLAHDHIRRLTADHSEPIPTPVALPKPTESEISRVMAELGRRGGKVGGKARAAKLSQAERSRIASAAAKQRWRASK